LYFKLDFLVASLAYSQINCVLTSEEVEEVRIILSRRGSSSLIGKLVSKEKEIGVFKTSKPTENKSSKWSFEKGKQKFEGEILLFKDDRLWHRYQDEIKAKDVNRSIFSSLSSNLLSITKDPLILKASSGFFRIGKFCYGGRINRV
tara:strand:+ start:149 stop:586 length:438 start_codon:yes stop_codon:yes gene_type:complete